MIGIAVASPAVAITIMVEKGRQPARCRVAGGTYAVVMLRGGFRAVAFQAVGETGMVEVICVPVTGVTVTAHAGAVVVLLRCFFQMAGLTILNTEMVVLDHGPIADAAMAQVAVARIVLAAIRQDRIIQCTVTREIGSQKVAGCTRVFSFWQFIQMTGQAFNHFCMVKLVWYPVYGSMTLVTVA